MKDLYKRFETYSKAYACYSDIVSGRDIDRKNASIVFIPQDTVGGHWFVYYEQIFHPTV